jgi:hypothetical protein
VSTKPDDHARGVDFFDSGRLQTASDLGDLAVLDEDIPIRHVADVGVHRDDEAVADQ